MCRRVWVFERVRSYPSMRVCVYGCSLRVRSYPSMRICVYVCSLRVCRYPSMRAHRYACLCVSVSLRVFVYLCLCQGWQCAYYMRREARHVVVPLVLESLSAPNLKSRVAPPSQRGHGSPAAVVCGRSCRPTAAATATATGSSAAPARVCRRPSLQRNRLVEVLQLRSGMRRIAAMPG